MLRDRVLMRFEKHTYSLLYNKLFPVNIQGANNAAQMWRNNKDTFLSSSLNWYLLNFYKFTFINILIPQWINYRSSEYLIPNKLKENVHTAFETQIRQYVHRLNRSKLSLLNVTLWAHSTVLSTFSCTCILLKEVIPTPTHKSA